MVVRELTTIAAQLGDVAGVVGGGVGRVCDDGVDPATGADGWGMQETSTPPSVSIAPCPIFARRAHPMLREVHFFEWHREKFYDSKMSHTAPITQTKYPPHTQNVFIHRFEFLRKSISLSPRPTKTTRAPERNSERLVAAEA